MTNNIQIVNGPSREELFDGLRLFAEKRFIPFLASKNGKEKYFAVIIHSIEAEDGSGQSWNLTISVNSKFISDDFFVDRPVKVEPGVLSKKVDFNEFRRLVEGRYPIKELGENMVRVKSYYSTKNRTGAIVIEE